MKIDFARWNLGGKLIFIGSGLAFLSLFLKWVDLGIVSASGFQQGGYLFFLLFLYPLIILLRGKPMNRIIGLVVSGLAILAGVFFAASKTVEIFDSTINAAGSGLYLFILSGILLLVGVLKYQDVTAPVIESDLEIERI